MAKKLAQQDFKGWTFQPVDEQGIPIQASAVQAVTGELAQGPPGTNPSGTTDEPYWPKTVGQVSQLPAGKVYIDPRDQSVKTTPGTPAPALSPGQMIVQDAIPKSLQVVAPKAAPVQPAGPTGPTMPDMTTQDPETFATLTANLARAHLLNPTVEDYNKAHSDALSKAQDFQKQRAENLSQQQIEQTKQQNLQKSAAEVELQKAREMVPIDVAKAQQMTPIEINKAVQLKASMLPIEEAQKAYETQMAEGLTPEQALSQYKLANPDFKGSVAPIIKALPTTENDKASVLINGYKALTQIHNAYTTQHSNAGAAQGYFGGSLLGPLASVTSPQTIAYNAAIDDYISPIARSMGDVGSGITMPAIQAQIRSSLPQIQDSDQVAGNKIYMRKKQFLNDLQTQRDLLVGHYDVSNLDGQIATMNGELNDNNGTLKKYSQPTSVVQSGTSAEANLKMGTHNVNAAAAAGATPTPAGSPPPPAMLPSDQPQQPQPQQPFRVGYR